MTQSTLDRVAEAICRDANGEWSDATPSQKEYFRRVAKAAIAAVWPGEDQAVRIMLKPLNTADTRDKWFAKEVLRKSYKALCAYMEEQ